jgi:hypothetical protein
VQTSRTFKTFDTSYIQPLEARIEFSGPPCSIYYLRAGASLAVGDVGGFAFWIGVASAAGC